jgi:DNA-binding transcriptional LysR family regulator
MLKTFRLVAQTGSFAAAADKAALTQAAVSLQMKALEDELGRRLFDRSGRQIQLTREGREILPTIEQMLALMAELEAKPASATNVMQGLVTIGAVVSVNDALSLAVAQLKSRHALLEVRMTTARSDELTAMVEAGEVDIAAVVERPDGGPSPDGLAWTLLYREPLMLVVNREIVGADIQRILREHRYLRYDRRVRTGRVIHRALATFGLEVNEYLEHNSIETIVGLIKKNVGVSVLPKLHRGDWEADPLLRLIPLGEPPVMRSVGLVRRADAPGRAAIATALAELLDERPVAVLGPVHANNGLALAAIPQGDFLRGGRAERKDCDAANT